MKQWQMTSTVSISTYTFDKRTDKIVLSNDDNGYVITDAVRIVKK